MSNKEKGTLFERMNQIVQESFKDSDNTTIKVNHLVKNTSSNFREFDIWLESKVNNYDIIVAIECKDYKTSIPVEKIEAFNSKCERVNGISKKIFISSNGFQKDAIGAAKDFNIELYTLEEISNEDVSSWISCSKLDILTSNVKILFPLHWSLLKNGKEIDFPYSQIDYSIYFEGKKHYIYVKEFVKNMVNEKHNNITEFLTLKLFTEYKGDEKHIGKEENIALVFNLNRAYLLDANKEKLIIKSLNVNLVVWLEKTEAPINKISEYGQSLNNNKIAQVVSADLSKNEKISLVKKMDSNAMEAFIAQEDKITKLKLLGVINKEITEVILIEK
jgi:hypothetical protein